MDEEVHGGAALLRYWTLNIDLVNYSRIIFSDCPLRPNTNSHPAAHISAQPAKFKLSFEFGRFLLWRRGFDDKSTYLNQFNLNERLSQASFYCLERPASKDSIRNQVCGENSSLRSSHAWMAFERNMGPSCHLAHILPPIVLQALLLGIETTVNRYDLVSWYRRVVDVLEKEWCLAYSGDRLVHEYGYTSSCKKREISGDGSISNQ